MALITTIEEIKKYAGVAKNLYIDSLLPDIEDIEQKVILPNLGSVQYNLLLNGYNNNTLNTIETKLLEKAQKVLSLLALEQYSSLAMLDFSDSGIRAMESETHKTPRQWQIDDIREYFYFKGYRAIDELLAYLEANTATFIAWQQSSAYTINKKFIVNNTLEFDKWHSINESRKTYISLLPTMRIVEMLHVQYHIGIDMYNRIKNEILTNISSDVAEFIDWLRCGIVKHTIAKALNEKLIEITHEGLFYRSWKSNQYSNRQKERTDAQERQHTRDAVEKDAQIMMGKVVQYLNQNASATKFPEYFNSSLYKAPANGIAEIPAYVNEPNTKVYYA